MRQLLIGAGLVLLLASTSCRHTPEPGAWRALFDGRSTEGWQMVGPGAFRIEEGQLVTEGGMGMLWYAREKFRDCQIRIVFQLSAPDDNSGVFIRIPRPPLTPWSAVNEGYEVQIDNTGDDWHRTGCLYSLTRARARVSPQPGQWSTLLITLEGKRTRVEVDGQLVTDHMEGSPLPPRQVWYEPDRGARPTAGYIGLQNHDDKTRVRFKEVSVRRLL